MCTRLMLICTALTMCLVPTLATAACSDSKIKKMAEQGKTVAAIAKTCKMDKDAVQSVLEDEDDDDEDAAKGKPAGGNLPSGAPLDQCGCWGPINPGYRQPAQQCRSGYAKPASCNVPCQAGGFAWRGVCT